MERIGSSKGQDGEAISWLDGELKISVRKLLQLTVILAFGACSFYLFERIELALDTESGGIGYRNSPYVNMIPIECRRTAALVGSQSPFSADNSGYQGLDKALLRPTGNVYSLPASEEALGFGMKGLPCMGYGFLMTLHADNYRRMDRYVNEKGQLVATVTIEVHRPYRKPTPNHEWPDPWNEIAYPPKRDLSLVRSNTFSN